MELERVKAELSYDLLSPRVGGGSGKSRGLSICLYIIYYLI